MRSISAVFGGVARDLPVRQIIRVVVGHIGSGPPIHWPAAVKLGGGQVLTNCSALCCPFANRGFWTSFSMPKSVADTPDGSTKIVRSVTCLSSKWYAACAPAKRGRHAKETSVTLPVGV